MNPKVENYLIGQINFQSLTMKFNIYLLKIMALVPSSVDCIASIQSLNYHLNSAMTILLICKTMTLIYVPPSYLFISLNRQFAVMERTSCFSCSTKLLALCHDHPSAGHFAVNWTWARLSELYFLPSAHDDLVNWVQSCTTCAAYKPPPWGYHKEPLQPIQSTSRFELVCYDFAGPFLPVTSSGNQYALIKFPSIRK